IARARRVDGMIVANTTLARPSSLREQSRAKEQGGLSGRPLFRLSTRMVAETYVRVEGAFPLIGVGGIDSGGAALPKIRAGASQETRTIASESTIRLRISLAQVAPMKTPS